MESIQFDILQGNFDVNLGSVLENVIAQQLLSNGFSLHFYDTGKLELDFVIQNGTRIDLVEVKSGKGYTKHTSLNRILDVEEWQNNASYVYCMGNVARAGEALYLPWYMVMFQKPDNIPRGMIHEVDISNL